MYEMETREQKKKAPLSVVVNGSCVAQTNVCVCVCVCVYIHTHTHTLRLSYAGPVDNDG